MWLNYVFIEQKGECMQYFGGKAKIAKPLAEFLQGQLKEGQAFVDMFCGSCNVVSKIKADIRIANDLNSYLTSMWICLLNGWEPPQNLSKDEYYEVKDMKCNTKEDCALKSFVGFGCSFSGKWWGGYAKDGGDRNYCLNAYNSVKDKVSLLNGVVFSGLNYYDVNAPKGSLIYCDIPYKDTTQYSAVEPFNHDKFYSWAVSMVECGFDVLVSEYEHNVPSGWEVVWKHISKQDIRNKNGGKTPTVEVVMKPIIKEPRNNNEAT